MKRALGTILCSINILMIFVTIIHTVLFSVYGPSFSLLNGLFREEPMAVLRAALIFPTLGFFIFCIAIWNKNDKSTKQLLLLLLTLGIYPIFYYKKAIKNNWL